MDCNMPVMDGFEASLLIKEILPSVKIIAQTGDVDEETKQKCLNRGMDGVIHKPIKKQNLK